MPGPQILTEFRSCERGAVKTHFGQSFALEAKLLSNSYDPHFPTRSRTANASGFGTLSEKSSVAYPLVNAPCEMMSTCGEKKVGIVSIVMAP